MNREMSLVMPDLRRLHPPSTSAVNLRASLPSSPDSQLPSWLSSSPCTARFDHTLSHHLPLFSRCKPLNELCTWGVGGPAKLFCVARHELQLASAIRHCSERGIRFLVIGKGSNLLFDDKGFDGCIILNRVSFLQRPQPGVYHAGSGYPFNALGITCSRDGFTGLEFASGIPGTVGGAVYMNAGSNGQETADVLKCVEVITIYGNKHVLSKNDLSYSYRSSPFQTLQGLVTITSASFELKPSSKSREIQRTYLERRKRSQPLTERTAGCVFRNPGSGDQSAGSLIEKAGLKGATIGRVKVSELHANFFTNMGGTQANDILKLVALVKEEVRQKFAIELEEEIVYVPYR